MFSILEMYRYNGEVSTTFAPAQNSPFAQNGWHMHAQTLMYVLVNYLIFCKSTMQVEDGDFNSDDPCLIITTLIHYPSFS